MMKFKLWGMVLILAAVITGLSLSPAASQELGFTLLPNPLFIGDRANVCDTTTSVALLFVDTTQDANATDSDVMLKAQELKQVAEECVNELLFKEPKEPEAEKGCCQLFLGGRQSCSMTTDDKCTGTASGFFYADEICQSNLRCGKANSLLEN